MPSGDEAGPGGYAILEKFPSQIYLWWYLKIQRYFQGGYVEKGCHF
ncbi:MAG: hypothetical protein QM667_12650 [Asticcacaulis sp.]